jgi:hypothetical protein
MTLWYFATLIYAGALFGPFTDAAQCLAVRDQVRAPWRHTIQLVTSCWSTDGQLAHGELLPPPPGPQPPGPEMPPVPLLAYLGKVADKVGTGNDAFTADGVNDAVLTVTFPKAGKRLAGVHLRSGERGVWDHATGTPWWALGVAATPQAPLVDLDFMVDDGASIALFAADYQDQFFRPGAVLTLTVDWHDGTQETATVTLP